MKQFILDYKENEEKALLKLNYRYIQAMRPSAFIKDGISTKIDHEDHLDKYVDAFQEGRYGTQNKKYLNNFLKKNEIELIQEFYKRVKLNKLDHFSFKDGLTRSLITLRAIENINFDKENDFILEIGPGSGILSALLGIKKYKYIGIENSEFLFFTQARILRLILDDVNFIYKNEDRNLDNFNILSWWKIPEIKFPKIKVVVMNSCINEINNFGFRYYLFLFQKFIDHETKIIVDQYGGGEFNTNKELLFKHYELYYNNIFNHQDRNDYLPISIFKKRRDFYKAKNYIPSRFLTKYQNYLLKKKILKKEFEQIFDKNFNKSQFDDYFDKNISENSKFMLEIFKI